MGPTEAGEGPHYSEIFVPIRTEVGLIRDGQVAELKFYLADVEAFLRPVAVAPDVGGAANAYFRLKDRNVWREDFIDWLEEAEEDDSIEDSGTDQSDDMDDSLADVGESEGTVADN